jgi:hypothetical protein
LMERSLVLPGTTTLDQSSIAYLSTTRPFNGNFSVVVRIRPVIAPDEGPIVVTQGRDRHTVLVQAEGAGADDAGRGQGHLAHLAGPSIATPSRVHTEDFRGHKFFFDRVYHGHLQDDFCAPAVASCLDSVLDRHHSAMVVAHGPGLGGKTYAVQGHGDGERAGFLPRAVDALFGRLARMAGERECTYNVLVSAYQVYGETVTDLLKPSPEVLKVREDAKRGTVSIHGLTEVRLGSPGEIHGLLSRADTIRAMTNVRLKRAGSVTHAVYVLSVESVPIDDGTREDEGVSFLTAPGKCNLCHRGFEPHPASSASGPHVHRSRLVVVDMAASEMAAAGERGRQGTSDGAHIARAFQTLLAVIQGLHKEGATHLPYRDSKLILTLKPDLNKDTRLIFLSAISPSLSGAKDSLAALKYAARIRAAATWTASAVEGVIGASLQSVYTEHLRDEAAEAAQGGGEDPAPETARPRPSPGGFSASQAVAVSTPRSSWHRSEPVQQPNRPGASAGKLAQGSATRVSFAPAQEIMMSPVGPSRAVAQQAPAVGDESMMVILQEVADLRREVQQERLMNNSSFSHAASGGGGGGSADQVRVLTDQLAAERLRTSQLTLALAQARSDTEAAQASASALTAKVSMDSSLLTEREMVHEAARADLRKARADLGAALKTQRESQAAFKALEAAHAALRKERDAESVALAETRHQLADARDRHTEAAAGERKWADMAKALEGRAASAEAERDRARADLAAAVDRARVEEATLARRAAMLETDSRRARTDAELARGQLAALESEVAQWRAMVDEAEGKALTLDRESSLKMFQAHQREDDLRDQCKRLQQELHDSAQGRDRAANELRAQIQDLTRQLAEAHERCSDLAAQATAASASARTAEAARDSLTREHQAQRMESKRLADESQRAAARAAAAEDRARALEASRGEMESALRKALETVALAERRLDDGASVQSTALRGARGRLAGALEALGRPGAKSPSKKKSPPPKTPQHHPQDLQAEAAQLAELAEAVSVAALAQVDAEAESSRRAAEEAASLRLRCAELEEAMAALDFEGGQLRKEIEEADRREVDANKRHSAYCAEADRVVESLRRAHEDANDQLRGEQAARLEAQAALAALAEAHAAELDRLAAEVAEARAHAAELRHELEQRDEDERVRLGTQQRLAKEKEVEERDEVGGSDSNKKKRSSPRKRGKAKASASAKTETAQAPVPSSSHSQDLTADLVDARARVAEAQHAADEATLALREQTEALHREVASLKAERAEVRKRIDTIRAGATELEAENARLKAELARLEEECGRLKAVHRVDDDQESRKWAEIERAAKESSRAALETAHAREVEALLKGKRDAEDRLARAEARAAEGAGAVAVAEELRRELARIQEQRQEELGEHHEALARASAEVERLKRELAKVQAERDGDRAEDERRWAELDRQARESAKAAAEDSVSLLRTEAAIRVESLEARLRSTEEQLARAETRAAEAARAVAVAEELRRELARIQEQRQEELGEHHEALARASAEVERLKRELAKVQAERDGDRAEDERRWAELDRQARESAKAAAEDSVSLLRTEAAIRIESLESRLRSTEEQLTRAESRAAEAAGAVAVADELRRELARIQEQRQEDVAQVASLEALLKVSEEQRGLLEGRLGALLGLEQRIAELRSQLDLGRREAQDAAEHHRRSLEAVRAQRDEAVATAAQAVQQRDRAIQDQRLRVEQARADAEVATRQRDEAVEDAELALGLRDKALRDSLDDFRRKVAELEEERNDAAARVVTQAATIAMLESEVRQLLTRPQPNPLPGSPFVSGGRWTSAPPPPSPSTPYKRGGGNINNDTSSSAELEAAILRDKLAATTDKLQELKEQRRGGILLEDLVNLELTVSTQRVEISALQEENERLLALVGDRTFER